MPVLPIVVVLCQFTKNRTGRDLSLRASYNRYCRWRSLLGSAPRIYAAHDRRRKKAGSHICDPYIPIPGFVGRDHNAVIPAIISDQGGRECRNPEQMWIPYRRTTRKNDKAKRQIQNPWIPACAGMTIKTESDRHRRPLTGTEACPYTPPHLPHPE